MGEEDKKMWIHQKIGKGEGYPQNDWPKFYKRLGEAIKVADGELESMSGATKNISTILASMFIGCALVLNI